jgi:ribosome-binding factor A
LSVLTPEDRGQQRVFEAVCHATGHIQHQLGNELTGKCCPQLQFKQDRKVKKTLETLRLIEEAENEYSEHSLLEMPEDTKEE